MEVENVASDAGSDGEGVTRRLTSRGGHGEPEAAALTTGDADRRRDADRDHLTGRERRVGEKARPPAVGVTQDDTAVSAAT